MSSKKFIIIFVVIVILTLGFFVMTKNPTVSTSQTKNNSQNFAPNIAELGETRLNLLISTTTEAKERGLSGMKSLLPDQAMLFVFETPVREGFWMKEMNFPIDIIWFDENKKIVDVWENANPDSYPKVVYPTKNSSFVLETNANFFKNHNLKIGDSMNLL